MREGKGGEGKSSVTSLCGSTPKRVHVRDEDGEDNTANTSNRSRRHTAGSNGLLDGSTVR